MVMVGLDGAGKTTILYKLKLNEIVTTIPTIGFNVETVQYRKLDLTIWDVGGQTKIRPLWRHYFEGSDVVVFVVDSNDAERLSEARVELHAMLKDDALRNAVVLVYANKQDQPNSRPVDEIARGLELHRLSCKWFVQSAAAVHGLGIVEGLDWVDKALKAGRREA